MFNISCNIDSNERLTRIIFGALLFIGAVIGLGRGFLFLMGIIMLVEGFLGWCGIPLLAEKFKLNDLFNKNEPKQ